MTYSTLAFDIEVFSEQDVTKVGLDLHSSDPSCEIIMCSYSYDDEPVRLWTIEDGPFPQHLKNAIADPQITKTCFNAQYERVVCKRSLKIKAPIRSFKCTMALAYMQSFTGGLQDVGAQVGLPEDAQKVAGGKKLINLFCKPQKVTKNQPHVRATAKTHPEEWKLFGEYCIGDTVAEKAIAKRLNRFPVLPSEWEMYWLDQQINDRGFLIDRQFIRNAAAMVVRRKTELKIEMAMLTGLSNPNSGAQLLPWLRDQGYPFNDLRSDTVKKVLGEATFMTPLGIKVLKRRQISSRMSVAKYAALDRILPDDNLCRYAFQYGGASRTLRWAGRRFQPHNLPRPPKYFEGNEDLVELGLDSYEHLNNCVDAIRRNDYEFLLLYVVEPMDVLVGALRCAIIPPEDHKLAVSDLSSIETRVTAAVSGCARLLRVIKEGLDPYKDFGSTMFSVPYDKVDKRMRQDSKPAVLGCFAADTPVLTSRGWRPIVEVTSRDRVWDGTTFVPTAGVVDQGVKRVIDLYGVQVTPGHEVWLDGMWSTAWDVSQNTLLATRAAAAARESLKGWFAEARDKGLPPRPCAEAHTYDLLNCGPLSRFTILTSAGPMLVHNCTYRLGGGELKEGKRTGLWGYAESMGVNLTQEFANKAVEVFRSTYFEIPLAWYALENAVEACLKTKQDQVPSFRTPDGRRIKMPVRMEYRKPYLLIWLPSGRPLYYHLPQIHEEVRYSRRKTEEYPDGVPYTKTVFSYMGKMPNSRKWVRVFTHGGKIFENCLTADTLILTPSGPKPIVEVTSDDEVWDGRAWVKHQGLVSQGIKSVIDFGGFGVTPNHKIDVDQKWLPAGDTSFNDAASSFRRHYRTPARHAGGDTLCRVERAKVVVDSPLRLREDVVDACDRNEKRKAKILRVQSKRRDLSRQRYSQNVGAPSLLGLAVDVGAVSESQTSSFRTLRRARNNCHVGLVKIRAILARYGANLRDGFRHRPRGQQLRLLQEKLSMVHAKTELTQHAGEPSRQYASRPDAPLRGSGGQRHRDHNVVIPAEPRLAHDVAVHPAERFEPVYDLVNAGPNHCFTVVGSDGRLVLVHNCVQAIARDVLKDGLLRAAKEGFRLTMHVHDELVAWVKTDDNFYTAQRLQDCMTADCEWFPELPLGADGDEFDFYRK